MLSVLPNHLAKEIIKDSAKSGTITKKLYIKSYSPVRYHFWRFTLLETLQSIVHIMYLTQQNSIQVHMHCYTRRLHFNKYLDIVLCRCSLVRFWWFMRCCQFVMALTNKNIFLSYSPINNHTNKRWNLMDDFITISEFFYNSRSTPFLSRHGHFKELHIRTYIISRPHKAW